MTVSVLPTLIKPVPLLVKQIEHKNVICSVAEAM